MSNNNMANKKVLKLLNLFYIFAMVIQRVMNRNLMKLLNYTKVGK